MALSCPHSCRRLNQARSSISLRRDAWYRCHTRSHSMAKTEMKIAVNETATIARMYRRSCERQALSGPTKVRSLISAACIHVNARPSSICLAASVLVLRDHCIASSAYSRNCSAFDICALRSERPCWEYLPNVSGSLSKTAHEWKTSRFRYLRVICCRPPARGPQVTGRPRSCRPIGFYFQGEQSDTDRG